MSKHYSQNVVMIVDLQFGSTGKGLIAGYLAEIHKPSTVINANMPNAGHTYINAEGRKWVHKVLPNGIVSPNLVNVMLGPQSVFNLERLEKEIVESADLLKGRSIWIHEDAVVLEDWMVSQEEESLNAISSTMQGSAAGLIAKMQRNPKKDPRAKNNEALKNLAARMKGEHLVNVRLANQSKWLELVYSSELVLAEAAQGYSLGMNAGFWPYCTSRSCTTAQFLADMAIPVNCLGHVIGTARVHPIRVGSTKGGFSGHVYPDQKELTWKELGQEPELTTVTGRIRRVFSFSEIQFVEAIKACNPNSVFLNFCNYDQEKGAEIANKYRNTVRYVGFGPTSADIVDLFEVQQGAEPQETNDEQVH